LITPAELREVELFKGCSDEQLAFFAKGCADVRVGDGDWIVREEESPRFFVLLCGTAKILKMLGGRQTEIGSFGPGDGFGEVPLLLGSSAVAGIRASSAARLARADRTLFWRMLHQDDCFARGVLANMEHRVALVRQIAVETPPAICKIAGDSRSAACYELRDFLTRMHVPFDWDERDGRECEVSFVSGPSLRSPSVRELAERLGLSDVPRAEHYDVAIVGGGPAGLAAAVYGASEGLQTLLIERYAPGGQAGMSSRIENYLGFPTGISGEDLADRAFHQAQRFGADVVVVRDVRAIDGVEGSYRLTLDDGRHVLARSAILATGVEYRSLLADGCDDLLNRGVYYGAAQAESQAMGGRDVHVVGGGNSAGQAALNFASYARSVTILIRGADLNKDMSQYLVERVLQEPNVKVLTQIEVAAVAGGDRLERIQLRDKNGGTSWAESGGLFVFIGAVPRTQWLDVFVARDERGFILTGAEARAAAAWPLERNPYLLETSRPGVFAVGDARKGSIKRVAAAVGEGSTAIALVNTYLQELH
jgi:thioredoxin reductase (NADPH)